MKFTLTIQATLATFVLAQRFEQSTQRYSFRTKAQINSPIIKAHLERLFPKQSRPSIGGIGDFLVSLTKRGSTAATILTGILTFVFTSWHADAQPGLADYVYTLPNGDFIQNVAGDDVLTLNDTSGSISSLQSAIDSARTSNPSAFLRIFLKPGSAYAVSSVPLVLGSKMCLTGNGTRIEASTTNTTATSLIRIAPGSSYVSVSNVILNGRLTAVSGIEALGVSRVNIDNTIVRDTGLAGIFLEGLGGTVFDSQLSISHCDVAGSANNAGIHLKNTTQAVCMENTSARNATGILLDGVSRATIFNNQCLSNSAVGLALSANSTNTFVIHNLISNSTTAISTDTTTQRNVIASNEVRSATTGIAIAGTVQTLHDNIFPSGVTSPVSTASSNHHIITTSIGFTTSGQNYFYPPTKANDHSATIISGKSNTNLTTNATTTSEIQSLYEAARSANPNNVIVLRLTAPNITGDAPLELSSNTCVLLGGRLNLAPNITGFTSLNATSVSISGGTIDGGNTAAHRGIQFAGCSRVLIDSVTIQNFGDKNVRVSGSDLIWFSKGGNPCIVQGCVLNGGAARGVWTTDATGGFVFSDNTISNVNMDGIDLDAFTSRALVKFNSVSQCVRSGIFVEEGARYNQVVGNTVTSNPIAINLYSYDVDLTSYNSIIANICSTNTRGIRVGSRSTKTTEHNFIFGNTVSDAGPQSALDAQPYGPENYFSQNYLIRNTDDIGSSSAIFFNSPALYSLSVPVVSYAAPQGLNGAFFQYQIQATHFPTLFTRAGGSIPLGLSLNPTTGILSGTPLQSGTFNLSFTATNLLGVSPAQAIQVVIQSDATKLKPVISSSAATSGKVASAFTHQVEAINSPTYFQGSSLPLGLTINATTGLITGTPSMDGTFAAKIYAANAGGTANQTLTIVVAPTVPQISNANSTVAQVGVPFSYRIAALNVPRSYGATNLPSGLTVNATNGSITGVPTARGNTTITLSASNAAGTATKALSISILPPVPVITSAGSVNANFGTTITHQITASQSPTKYFATNLPIGLTINATTGLITGTPGVTGTIAANVYATNAGGTANQTLTIVVTPIVPRITSANSTTAQAGVPFSYRIAALNIPRSYGATNLPAGLTVNATSGYITGVPTATGNTTITLSASNTAGTTTQPLSISILPSVPVITSAATVNATFGSVFTHQITATQNPSKFSATNLPIGLTINATTGLITGTPAVDGTFIAKVSASNAGGTANQSLTIVVASTAPQITSAALVYTRAGTLFSYRITAKNLPRTYGAAPLPAGLTLNATSGYITGVPTAAGNATITLSASNTAGTATQNLLLSIVPPLPVITSSATSSAIVGAAYSHQVTATQTPTKFMATGLPSGLSINTTTGLITGRALSAGTRAITISVSSQGGSVLQNHTLSVAAP